jgi:hypothetical protein
MDKFSQASVSSDIMRLVYKYDKSFRDVLSDLNMLSEDQDIIDPILELERYYNEQSGRQERN